MKIKLAKKNSQVSVAKAAQIAGVSYETVARWIRSGKLQARKVKVHGLQKEWRIEKADITACLKA